MAEPKTSIATLISPTPAGGKVTLWEQITRQTASDDPANPKTQNDGSLAPQLKPRGGQSVFDVVKNFKWTLSKTYTPDQLSEIPYIRLVEHRVNSTSINKQYKFYTNLATDTLNSAQGGTTSQRGEDMLNVYKELWPKDPTGFSYIFPYFNKTNMELGTEPWAALDSIGDAVKTGAGAFGAQFGQAVSKTMDLIKAGTNLSLNLQYPAVGVADRPKIFMAHTDRTITISVTLYNTINVRDWQQNREMLFSLMSQNHFNKRDYTTGIPPVFYEVFIPGSYYCVACCVTNIKIENLGNQRIINGKIVPDAYQLELTLTELVKPSKNQILAMETGLAYSLVNASQRG